MNKLPAANDSLVAAMRRQNESTDKAVDIIGGLSIADIQHPEVAIAKVNGNAPNIPNSTSPYSGTALSGLGKLTGKEQLEWGMVEDPAGFPVNTAEMNSLVIKANALQLSAKLQESRFTVQDAAPFRIVLAYRLIKELGRLQNDFSADQSLEDTDIWEAPREIQALKKDLTSQKEYVAYLRDTKSGSEPFHKKRRAAVEGLMVEILKIQQDLLISRIPYEPPGSSLDGLEESIEASEGFCYVMQAIAQSMNMHLGSKMWPDLGIHGLAGMFNIGTVRLLWPSRSEILYFEDLLLEEVTRKFTESGDLKAKTLLAAKYGMMPHESAEILRLAIRKTKDTVIDDSEIMKAKAVMRLEHLYDVAQNSGDIRAQLQAVKMQSDLLDLGRGSGGTEMDEIIAAIQRTSLERDIEEAKEDGRDYLEFEAQCDLLE